MKLKTSGVIAFLMLCLSCGTVQQSQSDQPAPRTSPIQVGETAPDFTLEDQNNQKISLASSRGIAPTVLVFYRGYW